VSIAHLWPSASFSAGGGRGSWSAAQRAKTKNVHRKQSVQTSLSLAWGRVDPQWPNRVPGFVDLTSLPSAAAMWIASPVDFLTPLPIVTIPAPPCGSGHTIGACSASADSTPASSTWKPRHSRCMSARFWSSTRRRCQAATPLIGLRDEVALRSKAMPQFREKLADNPVQPGSSGVGGRQQTLT